MELRVQAASHVFLPALQRGADAGLEGQGCSGALRTMRGFQGHMGVPIEYLPHLRAEQADLDGGRGGRALGVAFSRRKGKAVVIVIVVRWTYP